jgi:hypothetical protein
MNLPTGQVFELKHRDAVDWLREYVNAPHVVGRPDGLQHEFERLVAECLRADEVLLGVSLVLLIGLRGRGAIDQAVSDLLTIAAARQAEVAGDGSGTSAREV